ncbi:MAG: formate dehydrogenase accessory protein FdhE [Acidobacteria bacterium]|nr:formate dehydrogenase accessory protein FdhE [Acidobacteriota bacterium]
MYDPPVSGSSPSSARALPRDIAELKALAELQPELASAAQLQISLIETVRRVQGRLTTPWIDATTEELTARLAKGQSLLSFDQILFEWNDVRLLIRQIADILRRHDAIDADGVIALHNVGRAADLPERMHAWFDGIPSPDVEMLDEVLVWAARPYVQRTAEVLQQRVNFDGWGRRTCPVCAAEPDFSVITPAAERQLVCSRCLVRWAFAATDCPYCGNHDRSTITSMATPDGVYRVMICQPCGRYIKALDARKSARPLLPYADPIVTLPLDAAVMKRQGK